MLLRRKDLRKAVCNYFRSQYPLDFDTLCLHFLAQPALVYVNVFESCLKLQGFFHHKSNSLCVVAIDSRFLVF